MNNSKQYGDEFIANYSKKVTTNRISVFSPLVIFPLISFYFHDWWLLLDILFWNLGGLVAMINLPLLIALVATITYNIIYGFTWNSYFNIFFFCFTLGFIAFRISTNASIKFEETKKKIDDQVGEQVSG